METNAHGSFLRAVNFLLYSSVQFFVLTSIAMLCYPGGARYVSGANHYLFFQNFFSDLGATATYSGQSNLPSEILFIIALGSIGLALVVSSFAWKRLGATLDQAAFFSNAAIVFSILSGLCFIGIAATPWNHFLDAHNTFVKAGFSLLPGFIVCLAMVQTKNAWPKRYIIANCAYLLALLAYVFLLFRGPKLDTPGGLETQVVAQKIIVYLSILNLAYQALGLRKIGANSFPQTNKTEISAKRIALGRQRLEEEPES